MRGKKIFKSLIIVGVSLLFTPLSNKAYAVYEVECISAGISDYMRTVIDNLGGVGGNIKLLTPTFNLSEPQFEDMYRQFLIEPDTVAVKSRLSGTIGNAYNVSGQTVGYWVKRVSAAGGPIGGMHLAETGNFPGNPIPERLLSEVKNTSGIDLVSANLFNAFGNNGDFPQHIYTDEQIRSICGGSCGGIGVGLAGPFNDTAYKRAEDLGMGYVVGIVSSMGDVDSVVKAANSKLIPIVRIGSGDCSGSSAGDFNDAKAYARFIKAVSDKVGTKTVYFIIGPNEPDVEQWWSLNYGTGESCGCSTASGGTDQEPAPACHPNEFNLDIKGTIKSSYEFALIKDELGNTTYVKKADLDETLWPLHTFVNNVTINGAIVAIYPSYAFKGSDPFGNTQTYTPGTKGGMLYSTAVKHVVTDKDGNFELSTTNTCDEVWQYSGWKQYLVVMCPQNTANGVYPVVRDLYAFPLNKTKGEIYLGDINVACDNDLSGFGVVNPPPDLEYVVRKPDVFLACSNNSTAPIPMTSMKVKVDNAVEFKDSYGETHPAPWGDLVERVRNAIKEKIPFNGPRYGFAGIQGTSCDIRSILSSVTSFYTGIKADKVDLAQFYYGDNKPTSDAQMYPNNKDEKTILPLCDDVRKGNTSVSFDGSNLNTQTAGGLFNNLRPPFDGVVYDSAGVRRANDYGYAARYLVTDKEMEVCRESESANATRYRLGSIAPPDGICGDINADGRLNPTERPCPTYSNCGDIDLNGSIDGDEKVCISGTGYTYIFDSRYFPYDALYTGETQPYTHEIQLRYNIYNDSISPSYPPGRRTGAYSNVEGSRPDNDPNSAKFPAEFNESQLVGGTFNSVTKVNNISGGIDTGFFPASMILSTPNIFSSNINANNIRTSISSASSKVSFDSDTTFYKIGIMDRLCSCSLIEDGSGSSNGVKIENCINAKENASVEWPLGQFGEEYDPHISSSLHPLKTGYKYVGDARGISREDFMYYNQKVNGLFDIIGKVVDFFKEALACSEGDEEDIIVNGVPTGDKKKSATCGRTVKQITYGQVFAPWMPDFSSFKNALISATYLDVPFAERPDVISTCQVDTAVTKASNAADKEGSGSDFTLASTADKAVTDTINLVSSPTFGGFVPTCEVGKWEKTLTEAEASGLGLFAVNCSGGACYVGGGVPNEDWSGSKSVMFKSTDGGGSWQRDSSIGEGYGFIHGIGFYSGVRIAAGATGSVYKMSSASPNWVVSSPLYTKNAGQYTSYLYDATATLNHKYLITGTGHVFYGEERADGGITWKDLAGSDAGDGPNCSEDRDWPYQGADRRVDNGYCTEAEFNNGCTCNEQRSSEVGRRYCPIVPSSSPPKYDSSRPSCITLAQLEANPGSTLPLCCENSVVSPGSNSNGVPDCLCTGSPTEDNPDKTPRTPNCIAERGECWGWFDSSIWDVDCNSSGDCLIAGQKIPKIWYAPNDKLGDTQTWWRNRVELSNGYAMGVSFPGKKTAYMVGGDGNEMDLTGAFIYKSENVGSGNTWNLAMNGVDPGSYALKAIDCISEKDCIAVGNNGSIVMTTDGGQSWIEAWVEDEAIKEAKEDRVRFWDVAYMGPESIVVVGFKPKGGGRDVDGVIYTLGQCVATYSETI